MSGPAIPTREVVDLLRRIVRGELMIEGCCEPYDDYNPGWYFKAASYEIGMFMDGPPDYYVAFVRAPDDRVAHYDEWAALEPDGSSDPTDHLDESERARLVELFEAAAVRPELFPGGRS
jgi:hypothetical protein